ncbi:hypothetical protein BH10ACI2_BH10ACI2_25480 [soil metagenome]
MFLGASWCSFAQCVRDPIKANYVQGEVFGILNENRKEAFSGVSITVLKGKKPVAKTKTDKLGRFSTGYLKPGNYDIDIYFPGLMRIVTTLTVTKKTKSDRPDKIFVRLEPPGSGHDSCGGSVKVKPG